MFICLFVKSVFPSGEYVPSVCFRKDTKRIFIKIIHEVGLKALKGITVNCNTTCCVLMEKLNPMFPHLGRFSGFMVL